MKSRFAIVFGFFAVFVCGVYLVLYFALNSSLARARVQRLLDTGIRKNAISFRGHQWGPNPASLKVLRVVISYPNGDRVIEAELAEATLVTSLSDLAGNLHLTDIRIREFYLLLEWSDDEFLFTRAFSTGRPATEPKKESTVTLGFDNIRLLDGVVELRFPTWRIVFKNVHITGSVLVGGAKGLEIDAAIHHAAGRAWVSQLATMLSDKRVSPLWRERAASKHGAMLPFANLKLRKFSWKGDGFSLKNLELGIDDSMVQISCDMQFNDPLKMSYSISSAWRGDHLLSALSASEIRGKLGLDFRLTLDIPSGIDLSDPLKSVAALLKLAKKIHRPPFHLTLNAIGQGLNHWLRVPLNAPRLSLATHLDLTRDVVSSKFHLDKFELKSPRGRLNITGETELGSIFSANKYRLSGVFDKLQLRHFMTYLRRFKSINALKSLGGVIGGSLVLEGKLNRKFRPLAPKITSKLTIDQAAKRIRIDNWSRGHRSVVPPIVDWPGGALKIGHYRATLGVKTQ